MKTFDFIETLGPKLEHNLIEKNEQPKVTESSTANLFVRN